MSAGHGDTSEALGLRGLLRSLRRAYSSALLAGDPAEAERVARDAIDAGFEEPVIAGEVIAPAMHRIGELWERAEVTVADEHLATQITLRVLALQREAFRVARGRASQRVMVAAIEGEQHVVGLQMAGNLLTHAGFDVRFLGADVPIESLEPIVARHRPHVFCLGATMSWSVELLPLAIDELQRAHPGLVTVIGGAGVPERLNRDGSVAIVRHLGELVESVDALLRRSSLN